MEYSIGIYDMPEEGTSDLAFKMRMDEYLYKLSKDRWKIRWIGTSYRNTKLIIIFERVDTK